MARAQVTERFYRYLVGAPVDRAPDVEESSIPHFISFPVKNRADWKSVSARYRAADPTRRFPDSQIARVRAAVADGKMITAGMAGFYSQLRNWMGFENLSLCFYDDPSLVEWMVETWADLCVEQIRRLPTDIPLDYLSWWEDMASKNGPFVSPDQFRRFFLPAYMRVMDEARKRGCALSIVDCDGDPGVLVPIWLEAGVNIMFPLEVMAGVAEIPRELERIKPLLDQGGYVPHLDHLVPPSVSYGNFMAYLEAKGRLLGR